jgi:hypothetical protein
LVSIVISPYLPVVSYSIYISMAILLVILYSKAEKGNVVKI